MKTNSDLAQTDLKARSDNIEIKLDEVGWFQMRNHALFIIDAKNVNILITTLPHQV